MGFFEVNTGLLIDGLDADVNTSIVQAENAEEAKKKVCESLTKYFDELEFNHEENDSLFEVDTDYVIVSEIEPKMALSIQMQLQQMQRNHLSLLTNLINNN